MFHKFALATVTYVALLGIAGGQSPEKSAQPSTSAAPADKALPAGAYQYRGHVYLPATPQWLTWSTEHNGRECPADEPYAVNPTFQLASFASGTQYRPMESQTRTSAKITEQSGATDALDEVNAYRARRGLAPFLRDEGLAMAAGRAAAHRARFRISGHVSGGMGDFQFVPSGSFATSAGCAAWPPEMGWGSCCANDNYRYAGAAWAMGNDGLRYMHLFVR